MPISLHRAVAYLKRRPLLVALALLWTLLNAPKPLTVDDGAYYYFARQIAHDPLHPYDFTLFWYQWPDPANEILAPPVLPYWWAPALALGGERPWLWKLWLFPFCLLFVVALSALCRRFAHGLDRPLVVLAVLSPMFLPSLNLMLDVPSVALGLGAVALFGRACGRRSLPLALLSGLVAGLAMQTKYTAFLIPVVLILYALLFRRWWLGIVAAGLAGAVFVGWEAVIHLQQGKSHFQANLPQYRDQDTFWRYKLSVLTALLPMLGGVAPALVLLGWAAVGGGRVVLTVIGAVLLSGYVAVAVFEGEPFRLTPTFWVERPVEQVYFGLYGLLLGSAVLVAVWDLCVSGRVEYEDASDPEAEEAATPVGTLDRRIGWFLALWLLLEVAGYFALTPFPAARRVMGLFVVCTLLLGRLAAQTCRGDEGRRLIRGVVGFGVVLGLLFYVVDFLDACAQQTAAETAAHLIAEQDDAERTPDARVWYVGHWGFQYYAERAGMKPVVPDRSLLREGDWLIVPDDRWEQQTIQIDPQRAEPFRTVSVGDWVPLRTVRCYYGGQVPMEHHAGPRITVTIYRITAAWLPVTRRD